MGNKTISQSTNLIDSITYPRCINSQPRINFGFVKCVSCNQMILDDGLQRKYICEFCQVPYIIQNFNFNKQNSINDAIEFTYTLPLIDLESVILRVNQENVDYKNLMNHTILPFFIERQRVLTSGVCFRIDQYEFRVVNCGSSQQGTVGQKTKIYCYESYSDKPLSFVKIYTQRQNVKEELFHYFFTNQKENLLIQDSYIKVNKQEYFILQCSDKSGRLHQHTKVECISNVTRLSQAQFTILKQPEGLNATQILEQILKPYFQGLTRFIERGEIIRIGEYNFEVYIDLLYGFVIPNQTNICLIDITNNQQNNIQIIRRNNQENRGEQIEALHRLLNTFMQLNQDQQILTGCDDDEIKQLPNRIIKIDRQKLKNDDICLICFQEYEDQEEVKTLPCMHYFHNECIERWLKKSRLCPICKNQVNIN